MQLSTLGAYSGVPARAAGRRFEDFRKRRGRIRGIGP